MVIENGNNKNNMTFVIVVIVICLTVYGIMASKHNAEESKAFWGDHSNSSDVKRLKSRMKLLIDRVDLLEERINKLDGQSLKSRINRKTFNSN